MQNNPILVTVAIPFFNAQKYLSLAIESVIKQTYKNWRLLLIDDGSTDNSLSIAQIYQSKDHRIEVISDGENRNLGFRLNQIPFITDSEYLARMDADDIMHPQRLEKQVSIFTRFPDIDVLGTNAYSINEDSEVVGIRMVSDGKPEMVKVKHFIHPTIMAKTEWFRNNLYDVDALRIEDVELWLRVGDKYNFMMLSEPLFFYREFGDHYYKKYFKGLKSLGYLLKKHKYTRQSMFFSIKYSLSCLRSYIFFKINKEQQMILKRNEVIFDETKKIDNLK